jgi:KipI family sensor histidine kinase inhibitor
VEKGTLVEVGKARGLADRERRPTTDDVDVQVLPAGPDALLVECDDGPAAAALAAEAVRRRLAGHLSCTDIVPAARTVLLDGLGGDVPALAAQLPQWKCAPISAEASRRVDIAVRYDGPDLEQVARHWGTTPQDVVARHSGLEHQVQFCGFAPGFAYLTGLPSECAVPRLDRPRTSVPAGAVGLADRYTGIYPTASPGGWQLIGTALDVVLFDAERRPPALLTPGTRVRFVAAP